MEQESPPLQPQSPAPQPDARRNNPYLIPGSVVLAGIIIATAVVYTQKDFSQPPVAPPPSAPSAGAPPPAPLPANAAAVSREDHVRGPIDAPVIIIEYSDLECPFCKRYHPVMLRAVEEYTGRVAWVYRHFPLTSIHPRAQKEAEATECAAELGGNDAFWKFTDRVFEITPSNNLLDPAQLPEIAKFIGLDANAFLECLNSGRYEEKVNDAARDAISAGAQGTPYSVFILPNGQRQGVSGAIQYEQVKQIIDLALSQ